MEASSQLRTVTLSDENQEGDGDQKIELIEEVKVADTKITIEEKPVKAVVGQTGTERKVSVKSLNKTQTDIMNNTMRMLDEEDNEDVRLEPRNQDSIIGIKV